MRILFRWNGHCSACDNAQLAEMTLLDALTIFFWRPIYVFLKCLCKIIHVRNPAVLRDSLYLHACCIQQQDCIVYSFFTHIICECSSGFFFK